MATQISNTLSNTSAFEITHVFQMLSRMAQHCCAIGLHLDIHSTCPAAILTLSLPIPLRHYTLPYWSNPPLLIFDIRALWHSGLNARAPKCKKLTSSSAMAERPRELDQRFQMGGQFEAIID